MLCRVAEEEATGTSSTRRSRSISVERSHIAGTDLTKATVSAVSEKPNGTTVISISSHLELEQAQAAPLVSPEIELSVAESITSHKSAADRISLKSVTMSETSTDPEPETTPRPVSPPEAAPRTSLISPDGSKKTSSLARPTSREESTSSPSKHWGPERTIVIQRDPNQGLGISIVGGKIEAPEGSDSLALTGIFIKNVLEGSPAAATGQLNTGDRIIAVGDVDIRYASHEKAVEAIRQSGNPLRLVVQSLNLWAVEGFNKSLDDEDDAEENEPALDRTVGGEQTVVPPALIVQESFSPPKV